MVLMGRTWSNDLVELEAMQRRDFVDDIQALSAAYGEVVDQLMMEHPLTQQRFNDVRTLWWDVVSDDFGFLDTYVGPILSDPKSVARHKDVVKHLGWALEQRDAKNIDIWTESLLGVLRTYLRKVEKESIERFTNIRNRPDIDSVVTQRVQLERRTVGVLISQIEQLEMSQRLRKANLLADTAVKDAQRAAEDASKAAGVASRSKLTTRFAALGRKHFWAATAFRVFTAVGVFAGLWATLTVSLDDVISGPDTATAEAILRVSFLAGVLGLATYFGRQAAYHRDVSTWASTIKEQLLTFDGYVDPILDDDLRNQMRAAFAARVFGSSPESKDEPGVTLSSPVLSEVAAMFTKAVPPRT